MLYTMIYCTYPVSGAACCACAWGCRLAGSQASLPGVHWLYDPRRGMSRGLVARGVLRIYPRLLPAASLLPVVHGQQRTGHPCFRVAQYVHNQGLRCTD